MSTKKIVYKDRVLIEKMLKDGIPIFGIAMLINKHRNTIGNDLRNSGTTIDTYTALRAQLLARR